VCSRTVTPKADGRVHVYTCDGKGKTTAALGLAVRAAGHNLRSYIGQFMKGQAYGELTSLRKLPQITIEQYGDPGCIRKEEVTEKHVADADAGLQRARKAMLSGGYDLVVLDEIHVALWFELLTEEAVLELLDQRPAALELVFTGRRAPKSIMDRADLITEMLEVKHYYADGILARKGIEF
jgi:cob(I)alamin adenosyltransferase